MRVTAGILLKSALGLVSVLVLVSAVGAAEYHVDINTGNDGNPGTQALPWRTLTYGLSRLYAGDTLWVHEGTYTASTYEFYRSGTAGSPITVACWPGDTVYLNTTSNGFYVTREHVVIDGFIITPGSSKNAVRVDSNYVTIRNCTMRNSALAYKSNLSTKNHHHLIENCVAYNFSDIAIFPDELDSVIVRNCTLYDGDSVLMDPGGVSNLVLEGNFAYNTGHRLGELKIRWGNYEPQTGPNCRGAIVRRNVFVNGERYIILLASANGAAVYNNTLCKIDGLMTESGILFMQQDGSDSGENNNNDNAIKNNIFYCLSGDSTDYWQNTCVFMQDSMSEDYADQEFDYNCYYKPNGVEYVSYGNIRVHRDDVNGWYGGMYDVHSLVGVDPQMVDPTISAGRDGFRLQPTSPAVDAGGPLTTTVGAGSGTIVPVEDAKYFCNGLGLIEGDMIRIGSNPPVRVLARDIDASPNLLMVDTSVSWSDGDWVNLDYNGSGPDIGAFESDAATARVVGRYVFYNNSAFDGNDPAANAADDAAIATDKQALLPGQTATFANYTSYWRGINGVMVDIENLPGTPTVFDLLYNVGNDDNPDGWPCASTPISVTIRRGAGVGGSDRVTILWNDGAITNTWLRLTIKATANTGLSEPDVFYFGNAIGETGNSPSDAKVTPTDAIGCRNNPHTSQNPAAITDAYDFDRDTHVGPTDEIICRDNGTNSQTALKLITVP